jgi:hypothetical protein
LSLLPPRWQDCCFWPGYRRDCRALPFITDHFVLSSRLQEWVVSSMMLGAAIGALFNGWLSSASGANTA